MMKQKIASVIGSVVIIAVLCMIPANRMHAATGPLQWVVVDTPGSQYNIIASPSEINALAVSSSGTIFAADIPNGRLYRSLYNGYGWDDISANLTGAGAAMPVWDIAVSRDNPGIIAAVTSVGGFPGQIYFSVNAGETWQGGNFSAGTTICALDVSFNYIAVGTRTGAGTGNIYLSDLAKYAGWTDQLFTGDVLAVRISPTFPSDNSIIVVNADASGTYVTTGVHDIAGATTQWKIAERIEVTNAGAGSSPKAAQIRTADLELPLDFSSQDPARQHIFASTNDAGATGTAGIYRIDSTMIYKIFTYGAPAMISSIAYYGTSSSGKMIAGEASAIPSAGLANVWYSPNAYLSCPQTSCVTWEKSIKPPTGGAGSGDANALVAWSPDGQRAFCGTSSAAIDSAGWPNGLLTGQPLDESAFSQSTDDGRTWNQTGLIDTSMNFLSDTAAASTADTVYLASVNTNAGNAGFDSIWRSSGFPSQRNWERVFCFQSPTNDILLRISSPESNQPVYAGSKLSGDLFGSFDMGQTWKNANPGVAISDFAAVKINGINTLFVMENGYVRRGQSQGISWQWNTKVNTGLTSGHAITADARGLVAIGEAAGGRVAYSTNAGLNFVTTPAVQDPGNIHPAIDSRFSGAVAIYAASDAASGSIYTGGSTGWKSLEPPSRGFYGLVSIGTLYGLWHSSGANGADRALYPEDIMSVSVVEWDSLITGLTPGVIFTREPSALKASEYGYLWAIDNRPYTASTGRLWTYCDCMTPIHTIPQTPSSPLTYNQLFGAPVPSQPSNNQVIAADAGTGEIDDIKFSWRHETLAKEYELLLGTDINFSDGSTKSYKVIVPVRTNSPSVLLPSKKEGILSGVRYYWKVRVITSENNQSGSGEWSETMSFIVEIPKTQPPSEQDVAGPTLLLPADGAMNTNSIPLFSWTPIANAALYEITIAGDSAFSEIIVRQAVESTSFKPEVTLERDVQYYWQVKAVAPFSGPASPTFTFTVGHVADEPIKPENRGFVLNLPFMWIVLSIMFLGIIGLTFFVIRRYKKPR